MSEALTHLDGHKYVPTAQASCHGQLRENAEEVEILPPVLLCGTLAGYLKCDARYN